MREDLLPSTFDTKLARIEEEAGEVIKAIGKYHRFGATATDPKTNITYDNIKDIYSELSDLKHAIERFNC